MIVKLVGRASALSVCISMMGCAEAPVPPANEPTSAVIASAPPPEPRVAAQPKAAPPKPAPPKPEQPPEHKDIPLDPTNIPGAETALKEAEVTADDLRDYLFTALEPDGGYLPYQTGRVLRGSPNRIKLLTSWLPVLKKVVASPKFAEAWAQRRKEMLWVAPLPPDPPPRTAQQIRDEFMENMSRVMGDLQNQLAAGKMSPQARQSLEQAIAEIQQNIAAYDSAGVAEEQARNEAAMAEARRQSRAEREQERQAEIERRKTLYPESPKTALKARLDDFIRLCDSVDFGAQLTTRYGRRFFVNPDYEMKPPNWKLLFRAGKPTVTMLRKEALAWQSEL